MKTYWGGGAAPRILDFGLEGGEWSASRPGRFTPRGRAPGTHWIGGWMSSGARLEAVPGIELWNPDRPVLSLFAMLVMYMIMEVIKSKRMRLAGNVACK